MPSLSSISRVAALLAGAALASGCNDHEPKSSAPVEATAIGATRSDTAGRPILLVFSRDYCTPCQVMKPWVEELAGTSPNLDVVTVNVDRKKSEHLGNFFKISAVPTLVYLEADGHVARRTEGLAKKAQMMAALQELGWAR